MAKSKSMSNSKIKNQCQHQFHFKAKIVFCGGIMKLNKFDFKPLSPKFHKNVNHL
jgi:hypothetical protein